MPQEQLLIVEQQPGPQVQFQDLISRLAGQFQLDAYQVRQRMLGRGMALLTKGERTRLEKISSLLHRFDYRHWVVSPSRPRFAPMQGRGLTVEADRLVFQCRNQQVVFPHGAKVLAILADLSGKLVDQSVKQLLASHAFQGRDNIQALATEKTYRTILQGQPVLDFYLLRQDRSIDQAVRFFPGKYDHKGLGDRATSSSRQNLHQLIKLVQEISGDFSLHTEFGLANLPGCVFHKPDQADPDLMRKNLVSLTRYGWLMADIEAQDQNGDEQQPDDGITEAVTAAILTRNPILAASSELEGAAPIIEQVADEIRQAHAKTEPASRPEEYNTRTLPPPPALEKGRGWHRPGYWLGSAGAVLGIVIWLIAEGNSELFPLLFRYGFKTGAIQFLAGLFMFWGGFHFLRLKRQVENTPTSKVRSIAMGMVEVKGKALRQYALISPMTQMPCVFFRLTKYHKNRQDQWVISSVSTSGSVPFFLEDETGRVCVDPRGARISPGTKQEGTPGQMGLLLATGGHTDNTEKWVEEIIYEGTTLYVLGFATVRKQQNKSLAERKAETLRELKQDAAAMQKYDKDSDGRISQSEWDEARSQVEDQVLRQSLADRQDRKRQEEQVVITRGKGSGRPFIIAETHSEDKLASRFGLYTIPLFIGSAIFISWAIATLMNWLKALH